MPSMSVSLRSIPGTEAAVGWAGGHTVVIDRADGRAGGMGLGFNGGQMIALAIGGCLCNDLRYVAHDLGIALSAIEVEVTIELSGDPLLVASASVEVKLESPDPGAELGALLQRAVADSTVSNSITRGFPVTITAA